MNKVYIKFSGGLGNQMFQYAFLYSLLRKKDAYIRGYIHHNRIESPRKYALNCFQLSLKMDVLEQNERGLEWFKLVLYKKIFKMFYHLFHQNKIIIFKKLLKHGFFCEPDTFYYAQLENDQNFRYIEGFFQTHLYFDKYKDELRREFTIKTLPSTKNIELIEELQSCESVCVHIRRGDYNMPCWAETLSVCDYNYYCQGINTIKKYVNAPVFYIFSNSHEDLEWIKSNYDLKNVKYVDLGNADFEDFRLMESCKHFIISNSTYSWWAQYLATNPNKIVVAPSIWYRGEQGHYSKNIYMPNWHIIEV